MGIEVPTNVKVLSADFKELFVEVCVEVNRLSNLYADINRLRAIVDRQGGGKSSTLSTTKFFRVTSGGTSQVVFDDIAAYEYQGTAFDVAWQGNQLVVQNEISINAYDLAVNDNIPNTYPPGTNLVRDPLAEGTVVMCKELEGGYYVFSSVMPRFSVQC